MTEQATTEGAATTAATTTAATTTAAAATTTAADWTATLAPELKEVVTKNGFKDPAAVISAYANVNKLVGADKIPLPKDGVWDADSLKKLGVPDTVDGYKVARPEMPQGVTYDEGFEKSMLPVAHKLGLTPTQVNGLIAAVGAHRIAELQTGSKAQETQAAEGIASLKKEYGTAFDQRLDVAKRAVAHFGGQGLVDELNKTGEGNRPELIKAFAKIGALLGEDVLKSGGAGGGNLLTPEEAKLEFKKLQATPEYTSRDDVIRAAAVKKGEALMKMAFPEPEKA